MLTSANSAHPAGCVVEVRQGTYLTNPKFHDKEYFVELHNSELGLVISTGGTSNENIYCVMRCTSKDFLLVRNNDIIRKCDNNGN